MIRATVRIASILLATAAFGQNLDFSRDAADGRYGPVREETYRLYPLVNKGTASTYRQTVRHEGAGSRLRFSIVGPATGQFDLAVTGAEGSKPWSFHGDAHSEGPIWSGDITGPFAIVWLTTPTLDNALKIEISHVGIISDPVVPESLFDKKLHSLMSESAAIQDIGKAVVRLRIANKKGLYPCTGFLISSTLVMTNEHCINTDEESASAQVDFLYDGVSTWSTGHFKQLKEKNVGLDFAICELDTPAPYAPLHLVSRNVSGAEELKIIQHAAGRFKQISTSGCRVTTPDLPGRANDPANKTDFGHRCDTLGGSSGSPVFDKDGKVVGLHHLGIDPISKIAVNRAVSARLLLAYLEANRKDLFDQISKP